MTAHKQRPSLQRAVEWVALNDNDGAFERLDVEEVSGYISTLLIADMWGVEPRFVAEQIVKARVAHDEA